MESDRCKKLVSTIQQLEQTEVEELFKLLHNNGCRYTSNNHGVFLNFSWLTEDVIQKIETYVAFCVRSRHEVQRYESICDVLNQNIQSQKNQVVPQPNAAEKGTSVDKDKKVPVTKVSSSMKFYLLKKRYAKQTPYVTNTKNDIDIEPYPTPT